MVSGSVDVCPPKVGCPEVLELPQNDQIDIACQKTNKDAFFSFWREQGKPTKINPSQTLVVAGTDICVAWNMKYFRMASTNGKVYTPTVQEARSNSAALFKLDICKQRGHL